MLKFSVPNCNTQLRHIFYVHNCFHERNVLWVTVATHQALFKVSNWMCAEIVRNWTYRWTVTEGWIWIRRFYWFPYIQEYEGVTSTNVVLIRIHISNNSTETFFPKEVERYISQQHFSRNFINFCIYGNYLDLREL